MSKSRIATIALVEDDPIHAELYSAWLTTAGFTVHVYPSAGDFRRRLGAESVDAIVLDWMLPDVPGIELLDWLKHSPHTRIPVIFLTANQDEADVVTALRAGADDYVAKPARSGELVARVQAALRRSTPSVARDPVIDAPPFRLELVTRRLFLHGELQELTDREFELLAFMFRRAGRVISRELLLAEVWNLSGDVTTRTIDTHISRLRKKLGLNGDSGWRIASVYLHGYRLERVAGMENISAEPSEIVADE